MQKKFFLSACFYGIFFCMTFFLSSCTLLDMMKDSWRENDPVPVTPPYATNLDTTLSSPHFQAEITDRMVTDLSMLLVMNSLSGSSVSGIRTEKNDTAENPGENRNVSKWSKEVFLKLLHSHLLLFSPSSPNYLKSNISGQKWNISFFSKDKELFTCSIPLAAPSPPGKK